MPELSRDQVQPFTTELGSDPTVDDDVTKDFRVGDLWRNSTTGVVFRLLRADVGNAWWDPWQRSLTKTLQTSLVIPEDTVVFGRRQVIPDGMSVLIEDQGEWYIQ